jgi:hypothetical protein
MKHQTKSRVIILAIALLCFAQSAMCQKIEIYFSPKGGAAEAVAKRILAASDSVLVMAYAISEPSLTRSLIAASERGVACRLIVDRHEQNAAGTTARKIKKAGVPTTVDRACKLMHNKFAVIDGKFVITGSMNWSEAGDSLNAENTLIIEDEAIAKIFTDEFNRRLKSSSTFQLNPILSEATPTKVTKNSKHLFISDDRPQLRSHYNGTRFRSFAFRRSQRQAGRVDGFHPLERPCRRPATGYSIQSQICQADRRAGDDGLFGSPIQAVDGVSLYGLDKCRNCQTDFGVQRDGVGESCPLAIVQRTEQGVPSGRGVDAVNGDDANANRRSRLCDHRSHAERRNFNLGYRHFPRLGGNHDTHVGQLHRRHSSGRR